MSQKYRLAVIAKHPVHTQLPLYKRLARHPEVDLTIFFGSNFGIAEGKVPVVQRGITVKMYDVPDLSDIAHKFLKNYGTSAEPTGFWSPIAPGIWRELRKEKFDAIIIHGYGTLLDIVAYLAARLTKTPVMMMGETYLRSDRQGWKGALKDIYVGVWLKGVRACLPIGTISKRFYLHHGVSEECLFIVPYSVENAQLRSEAEELSRKKDQLKSKYGIRPGLPVIIFVGRLIERKHPLDIIKAFQRIQQRAVLVIVGDGPRMSILRQYIVEHEIENVHLLGSHTPGDTRGIFSVSDIFVLSSSYEPWGFVVNEAMCFGLPVIAADGVAAAYDLIEQGGNGYMYASRDVDALARYFEELVDDPPRRAAMGMRSVEIIASWNYALGADRIVSALRFLSS